MGGGAWEVGRGQWVDESSRDHHYSASINTFLRDLNDSNQLIRGMALRVLTSIRVREVVQVQLTSLKKCAADSSAYVRKTSAHACGKIFQTDPDAKEEVCEAISLLLGDKNTQVLSSALAAFTEVCPEDLALLHPHYRKLCSLLADLDDWGQIAAMNVLGRYARTFFARPTEDAAVEEAGEGGGGGAKKPKKDFYEEEEESEEDSEEESEEEESEEEAAAPAPKPARITSRVGNDSEDEGAGGGMEGSPAAAAPAAAGASGGQQKKGSAVIEEDED
jgi:AP-3 complex subunit beta